MDVTATRVTELSRSPLPLPGWGQTWERWRALADLASVDLSLAKVVEPHHDALAILTDLGAPASDGLWAVWAAEPPFAVLRARPDGDRWRLDGTKAFCSGAAVVSHALVTATDPQGESRLFRLVVDQAGISVDRGAVPWSGPGMADAGTVTLTFDDVVADPVGAPGDYTARPGFWHGAIGVAACWWGGARAAARPLEESSRLDAHGLAHRGAVRAALLSAEAVLRHAAHRIDAEPEADAESLAHAVRSTVVDAVDAVVRHVGRATGPGPLAFDPEHAGRIADLQVFVRQHHAERDLARLGELDPVR